MQVACPCGEPFTIEAGPFPRALKCHACGHKFTVLDTGEIIEFSVEKRPTIETGISADAMPSSLTPTNAICSADNFGEFASASSAEEERRLFELQWQKAFDRHMIGVILPTRRKGLVVAVGIGVTFLVMMAIEWICFNHVGNPVLIVGAGIGLVGGSWLYRRGTRFENAEAEWNRKRIDLYAKYHLSLPAVAGMASLGWVFLRSLPGILIASGLLFCVCVIFFGYGIYWVGVRNLEINFVVIDAETGKPIAGGLVEIADEKSGRCADCDGPIKLVTNDEGVATQFCKNCMCGGYSGWELFFRWSETYGTTTPSWRFEASAPGYGRSGRLSLHKEEFRETIERGDKGATMQVAIKLNRVPAGK